MFRQTIKPYNLKSEKIILSDEFKTLIYITST